MGDLRRFGPSSVVACLSRMVSHEFIRIAVLGSHCFFHATSQTHILCNTRVYNTLCSRSTDQYLHPCSGYQLCGLLYDRQFSPRHHHHGLLPVRSRLDREGTKQCPRSTRSIRTTTHSLDPSGSNVSIKPLAVPLSARGVRTEPLDGSIMASSLEN